MEATKNAGTLDGIFLEAAEPEEREDLQDLRELKLAGIPLVEQETTINYRRSEDGAEIWTSDRTVMTKLDRMCQEAPEIAGCIIEMIKLVSTMSPAKYKTVKSWMLEESEPNKGVHAFLALFFRVMDRKRTEAAQ